MKSPTTFFVALVLMTSYSFAAVKWANCPSQSEAQGIQEVFWKSDINGGSGPTYELGSGQIMSNLGIVCSRSKILDLKTWNKELTTLINPEKSITSFKFIKNASDQLAVLMKFDRK